MHKARSHSASSSASPRAHVVRSVRPRASSIRSLTSLLLLLISSITLVAEPVDPLARFRFIENRGQWDARGRYMLDRGLMRVWMGLGETVYSLSDEMGRGALLRHRFIDAVGEVPRGEEMLPERWGFSVGARSADDVRSYAEVRYRGLYRGIDARYYQSQGRLKYDLIVAPGADPAPIRFTYEGARSIAIERDGSLVIATSVGEIREGAPFCYQVIDGKRRVVAGRFIRDHRGIGFALGAYDRAHPLVIDPTLIYSSYLGGARNDAGRGITVDATGNIYVTGTTLSDDFPAGAAARRTSTAIFVVKLDPTGSALLAARVIDGNSADEPTALRLRRDGSLVVAGTTFSSNFPTTTGAYDRTANDVERGDGFVMGLGADLGPPLFSTYFGGSDSDRVEDMVLDDRDSIFITGWTRSSDLPLLLAKQGARSGGDDAFLAQFTQNGGALIASTYLGGALDDRAIALATEAGGGLWVTGWTRSNDFRPPGIGGNNFGSLGGRDCFIAFINFHVVGPSSERREIIGGSLDDEARAIAVAEGPGARDTVHITGRTLSPDYPITTLANPGAWFLTRIVGGDAALGLSRTLGVIPDNGAGEGIQIGSDRDLYVTGWTTSNLFPITSDAVPSIRSNADVVFLRIDPAGNVVHSSVIGGSRDDVPWRGSYLTSFYDLYITGVTRSTDLPLRRAAHDSLLNRDGVRFDSADAFVMRFGFKSHPTIFSRITHRFDTLRCDTTGVDTLFVYNVGDADLVINRNIIGSRFAIIEPDPADVTPDTVKPGGSLRYIIRFNSNVTGVVNDTLFIYSNDPQLGSAPFKIAITAVRAVPSLNAAPDEVSFGSVLQCLTLGRTSQVRITNGGISPVTILSVTRARAEGSFQISPVPQTILQQSASLNLTVAFKPQRSGPILDTILIRVKECDSTFRIPLAGIGDSLRVGFTPDSIGFGALPLCVGSRDTIVTLVNRSGSTLRLVPGQSPAISSEFTRLTPLPDSLRSGESIQIGIRYLPLSGSGSSNASLQVRFIECDHVAELPLSGERSGSATLAASVNAIDFGILQGCAGVRDSAEQRVTLHNRGNSRVTVRIIAPQSPFQLVDTATSPFTLDAGDSTIFTVRYLPTASGDHASELLIPFAAGPCADTIRISLNGSLDSVHLFAPVTAVDFPTLLACDRDRDTTLILINRSRTPITIERIDSTQGAAHLEPIGLPRVVAPGDTFTVRVAFKPQQSGDAVERIVYGLAPCNDSIVITLRGRKEGVAYSFREDRLDFPPRLTCSATPARDSFLLHNTGDNVAITVRSIAVLGSPELGADASLVGRVIPADDSLFIPIDFTPGTVEGTFVGTLEVVLDPCGDTLRREIAATLVAPKLDVTGANFGDVEVGKRATASITIRNSNPETIELDTLAGITPPFKLLSGGLPATLTPGDSVVLEIEFAPLDTLIYAPTLQASVSAPCAFTGAVPLFGRGAPNGAAVDTLCLDMELTGLVGDTVELVIRTITPTRALGAPEDIIYSIGYDEERLQLLDVGPAPRARIVGGVASQGIAQIEEQGVTAIGGGNLRIRFRLLLGREPVATVRLDSVTLRNANLKLGLCDGLARIEIGDHCVVTRVFKGKYPNRLEDIVPNPSGGVVEITYQQLEDARAVLRIFDMNGREVKRPLEADLPGGRYTVRFSVDDLPAGAYLYSIEAGSFHAAKKMIVGN